MMGPFVISILWNQVDPTTGAFNSAKQCSYCKKFVVDSKPCSACHKARYCNATCQKEHWQDDMELCKQHRKKDTQATSSSGNGKGGNTGDSNGKGGKTASGNGKNGKTTSSSGKGRGNTASSK